MDLVEWLLANRTPLELAKELAKVAKENAALKTQVVGLEVEVFWMKVADREGVADTLKQLDETVTNLESLSSGGYGIAVFVSDGRNLLDVLKALRANLEKS